MDLEYNNANSNGGNVVAINLKFLHLFFSLKILKFDFKMKVQNFLDPDFLKYLQNMTFHIFHLAYHNEMNQTFPYS